MEESEGVRDVAESEGVGDVAESDLLVQCPHEELRQRDPPVLAGMCMFRMPVTRRYLELFESSGSECSAALVVSSPSSDSSSPSSSSSSLSEPDSSFSDAKSPSFRLARASYTAAFAAEEPPESRYYHAHAHRAAGVATRWQTTTSASSSLLHKGAYGL